MKKLLVYLLVFSLTLAMLVSCRGGDENINEKTARECADSVVSLMSEMIQSKEYEDMYGLPSSYKSELERIKSGDYKNVSAVYEVSVSDNSLITGLISFDGMSDRLESYLRSNMLLSIASRINQRGGVSAVALSSAFSASESYVCTEIDKDTLYLYVFESGSPILLSLIPGEDGTVKITGNFIISTDFKVENAGVIEESFKNFGLNGVTVKAK